MERTEHESSSLPNNKLEDELVFKVGNAPIMKIAIEVLTRIGEKNKIILKARGNSIPNAVATANIITEKMLKGNSKISQIILDSENPPDARMISTIEIILTKKPN